MSDINNNTQKQIPINDFGFNKESFFLISGLEYKANLDIGTSFSAVPL